MSTNVERCPACLGAKQMVSMGLLLKDCSKCDAVGYIAKQDKPKVETEIIIKKKGRKKRDA